MPGRKTHLCVGAVAGTAMAAIEAKDQPNAHFWIETLGGALGGCAGGIFPDLLEPAVCSWHRGFCHSATAGGAALYMHAMLAEWAKICRQRADQSRIVPLVEDLRTNTWIPLPRSPMQQAIAQMAEFFWRFLAGCLNGLAAGYVSHLVL